MAQFRKKPVIIDAVQHFAGRGQHTNEWPLWLIEAINNGIIFARGEQTIIKTLEGEHIASEGDWIIRGVKGELYPCKPDIFAATYEPAALTPRHEAPAEGAGEREAIARIIDPAAFLFAADELMKGDPSQFNALSKADRILALRARSSAPEAREGDHPVDGDWQSIAMWMGFAASVIKSGEPWTDQCHREFDEAKAAYGRLSTHPAAPSADKLRIAGEALEPFARACLDRESQNVKALPGGASVRVTLAQCRTARQALAALKAEGAK